jgi:nitroimidazol reductase NimA-like FMN-containing flavoprotein (pyridoxamine 5'-phosphate oxidase superfamily)
LKKAFTITDKKIIKNILDEAEFGTIALCSDNRPYSLPLNFVELKGDIYFHGAQKGKKLDLIKQNSYASFSVVEPYSVLPSYFSTDDGSACPATHMFKSVIIDGEIKLVEEYEEKAEALNELMKKLQSEGKYIPLHDKMYEKIINATALFKLVPTSTTCKVKFGQNFSKERFERVSEYLKQRGTPKDMATLNMINKLYNV